jgi:TatD DNase family protein
MPDLFDAHAHLQDPRLIDQAAGLLRQAHEAGVVRIACSGTKEADWAHVLDLAKAHNAIVPSFGLHPWFIDERSEDWLNVLATYLLQTPSGIGEIGLDHALKEADLELQEAIFLAQLDLAAEMGRPVSIHCRGAWGRMQELLESADRLPERLLFHSYSGGTGPIEPLAARGAWFSYSGTITRSRNRKGHDALKATPPDRLLLETDAPDLGPVIDGQPPTLNVPANLVYTLRAAAQLLNISEEELAERTRTNAVRFFDLT